MINTIIQKIHKEVAGGIILFFVLLLMTLHNINLQLKIKQGDQLMQWVATTEWRIHALERQQQQVKTVKEELPMLLSRSLKQADLDSSLSNMQINGEQNVELEMQGVSFTAWMHWWQELSAHYRLQCLSLHITRAGPPGEVNVKISIALP